MSRRRERPYDDLSDDDEAGRHRTRRREDSPAADRPHSRSRSRSPSGSPKRRADDSLLRNRLGDRHSRSPSRSRSATPPRSASPPPRPSRTAAAADREADRAQERGSGADRETDRQAERGSSRERGRGDRDRDRSDVDRRGDRQAAAGRGDRERSPDRGGRDRRPGGGRDGGGGGYDGRDNRGQGRSRGKERWGYNAYLAEEGGGGGGGGDDEQQQQPEKRKGRGFAGRDAGREGGREGGRQGGREGRDSGRPRSRSRSRSRGRAAAAGEDGAPDAAAAADGAGAAAAGGGGDGDAGPAEAAAAAAAAGGAEQNGAGGDKEGADFLQKKAAVSGRAGGAYIPPFRLARMMAEIDDKNSAAAQKLSWEALRKSLNGLINKVNAPNIKEILPELFGENLLRGRGLFCQALMKAQLASPTFSPLYAALVAVVNTKFPEIGELLLHRVIAQFKRAYKRNDKPITIAAAKFLAHLINQGVLHEVLALEMLILLLENPSDDSVEMAVDFCKEVGAHLQDVAPTGLHSVFERFRAILHEGAIDKRCQYMIEGLFAVRKAGFAASGHPAVRDELDLVEDEDQITHEMSLEDKHDPQAILNVFREDPEYAQHEAQYRVIAKELLGEESEEEGAGDEEGGGEGSSSDADGEDSEGGEGGGGGDAGDIADETGTDVVNLRRTIYLTIMSSLDFEEAGHKLMKITLRPGQECEIPIMIIECCSQEKTFVRYYALLGSRFCMLRKEFQATFEDCFGKQYSIIHRLETNKLRNVAKLFAHLLANDAISWGVLGCIRLTEDDTTSSSRIFIKYLFQELSEYLGLVKLNARLAEPSLQDYFSGLFPQDTMQNMRFSINFFTSIGLGGITDRQRQLYKEMPRIMAERKAAEDAARKAARGGRSSSESGSGSGSSSSSSSSSSGSDSSSSSSSDSESEDSRDRRRKKSSRDRSRDRRRRSSSRDRRRR